MKVEFDFQRIRSVEFFVCIDHVAEAGFFQVPVDDQVQEALREMLGHTVDQLQLETTQIPLFEPGEKYGAIEPVVGSLRPKYMDKVRAMYQTEHFESNPKALLEPASLAFYFAGFHDENGNKLLGVKRATQFKGVLSARSRLVAMFDDTLQLVDQDVFRLDQDFDYLVTSKEVLILRPTGFEYTAGIAEAIGRHAIELLTDLDNSVPFIDFRQLETYVASHRRAERLVASLHARGDLANISSALLKKECRANKIEFKLSAGKMAPKSGSEMAFLELLDRRRYAVELIDSQEEYYVAASRRGGKGLPPP